MIIRVLLFSVILLLTRSANGQTDFRPGYVFIANGDSLIGEIDYRDDIHMSEICRFRSGDNENEIKYTPDDIIGFRFMEGKYFVSKEVKGRKVFLEFLIRAKVSVFFMRDNKGDHYYLEKESLGLTELPYEEGEIVQDSKVYFNKPTKYIGVLNYYMQDAPDFQSRIYSMGSPEHENLIRLARDYNQKVSKDAEYIVYEKKIPYFKVSVEPFIRLGKYNSKYTDFGSVLEYGSDIYLWMPRASEKLYFKTGLIFAQADSGNFFKVPLQLQYLYPSKHFRPRATIGVDVYFGHEPDKFAIGYLPQFGIGFIYKVYKKVYFSADMNLEYTPFIINVSSANGSFDIISRSVNFGFYIDL